MKRNYYLLTEDIENHTILDMNCMELYIGIDKKFVKSQQFFTASTSRLVNRQLTLISVRDYNSYF